VKFIFFLFNKDIWKLWEACLRDKEYWEVMMQRDHNDDNVKRIIVKFIFLITICIVCGRAPLGIRTQIQHNYLQRNRPYHLNSQKKSYQLNIRLIIVPPQSHSRAGFRFRTIFFFKHEICKFSSLSFCKPNSTRIEPPTHPC